MKKGKVFTKGQIGLVVMVFVLAGAIWLNSEYTKKQKNVKYMGETTLVGSEEKNDAAMVGANIENDYFSVAVSDREKAYKEAEDALTECLNSSDEKVIEKATEIAKNIAKRKADEVSIENLLKAKGFKKALVIIGDENVTAVVEGENLTPVQTEQIKDAVTSFSSVTVSNIKIVTVKG